MKKNKPSCNLWNFFPDMSANHLREAEFCFERHYLTRQQVSDLQDMPDVDVDALRIALVDDHPPILRGAIDAISAALTVSEPVTARRVEELLATPGPYDVVILDLQLGDGSDPASNVEAVAARGWPVRRCVLPMARRWPRRRCPIQSAW